MKNILFYLKYFSIKKRLKEVFGKYLLGHGDVKISLLRKRIILSGYSSSLVSSEDSIALFINKSFDYFKIDRIELTLNKLILSQSKLPELYCLPKAYKPTLYHIPIGCNDNKEIVSINTEETSSTGIFIPSGGGKTRLLRGILKNLKEHQFCGFKVVIWDPKNDGEFDFLENANSVSILRSQQEALDFHRTLKESVEAGENTPTLLILEEYPQWTDSAKFRNNKEAKEKAQELLAMIETAMQLYRSRKIHTFLVNQNLNKENNPADINNVTNKIFGYVSNAQGVVNNVAPEFVARADLKKGKFIVSIKNEPYRLLRGLSE